MRLTHVPDDVLLRDLATLIARERTATAQLLAHLAEVEHRRLYASCGYTSMFEYCVRHLHLSEDAACNRLDAARKAREFPAMLAAIADGRLHLSAVRLLSPHLDASNVDALIAAATH